VFFDKNVAGKNKVKAKLKQSKGCACEAPLAEIFFLPGNGARKQLDGAGVNIDHRPVGNPKRKV
jgi:hypothetical protein